MKRFALLSILCFFSFTYLHAQRDTLKDASADTLVGFDGNVYIGDGRGKDVKIQLFDKNALISTYVTGKYGKFVLDLERDKYYIVEFTKKNYVTKRILIDTRIPSNEAAIKEDFHFDVFLIKLDPKVDYSILDFPMAIIQYDAKKERFDYDPKYTKARQSEQKSFID